VWVRVCVCVCCRGRGGKGLFCFGGGIIYSVLTHVWREPAYDEKNLKLYVTMHQLFALFVLPSLLRARVSLTTVLQLTPARPFVALKSQSPSTTYLIQSQNDLYQVGEVVKFASVFGLLRVLVLAWQFVATGLCVLGAGLGAPVTWVEENVVGGNAERRLGEVVEG